MVTLPVTAAVEASILDTFPATPFDTHRAPSVAAMPVAPKDSGIVFITGRGGPGSTCHRAPPTGSVAHSEPLATTSPVRLSDGTWIVSAAPFVAGSTRTRALPK